MSPYITMSFDSKVSVFHLAHRPFIEETKPFICRKDSLLNNFQFKGSFSFLIIFFNPQNRHRCECRSITQPLPVGVFF